MFDVDDRVVGAQSQFYLFLSKLDAFSSFFLPYRTGYDFHYSTEQGEAKWTSLPYSQSYRKQSLATKHNENYRFLEVALHQVRKVSLYYHFADSS